MHEVVPGTVVSLDRNGIRRRGVYRQLETRPHDDEKRTTVGRIRDLLEDITTRQLVSDVPRCVLLSGGLDSSALTALAAGQLDRAGEKLSSFAVDFADQDQNFVPSSCGRPRTRRTCTTSPSWSARSTPTSSSTPPPGRSGGPGNGRPGQRRPARNGDMFGSLYLLFKAIREHSTVALSGESADEVFGGYLWFHDPEVVRGADLPVDRHGPEPRSRRGVRRVVLDRAGGARPARPRRIPPGRLRHRRSARYSNAGRRERTKIESLIGPRPRRDGRSGRCPGSRWSRLVLATWVDLCRPEFRLAG